jgi:hypothetical protein
LLGDRLPATDPRTYGETSEFFDAVRVEPYRVDANTAPGQEEWFSSSGDCLTFIRNMCVNLPEELSLSTYPQASLREQLTHIGNDPRTRFNLLSSRYACPLNFSHRQDEAVREYVLLRTMVHDRAAIEKGTIVAIDTDELLLKLNLLAIHASRTDDLRFLDSLNYYYELLPSEPVLNGAHNWLWPSFLVLYARALAAHI